ncbi:hypothetical protein GXM_07160 [Nostoc sphaeroides CCNUC1]|uniref:Uncharacterized protein n=1 Tax=Nostoc sphaeroides CCNUC1 TaxID=2653204 RepID=A0A5P8WBV7_9NOSO|nr:hypothetical protein GXM_07160 [Nostoc sphaeroides CCNUC1]
MLLKERPLSNTVSKRLVNAEGRSLRSTNCLLMCDAYAS